MRSHLDPVVIDAGRDALAGMPELARSLVYAALLTDDGFEIAHHPTSRGADSRFASMASSAQALGEAVVRELHIGDSRYVVMAAEHGHVVQRRVAGTNIVLAALFDADETLGTALSVTRLAADRMSSLLTSQPVV
jgi:uncharacterized protein